MYSHTHTHASYHAQAQQAEAVERRHMEREKVFQPPKKEEEERGRGEVTQGIFVHGCLETCTLLGVVLLLPLQMN